MYTSAILQLFACMPTNANSGVDLPELPLLPTQHDSASSDTGVNEPPPAPVGWALRAPDWSLLGDANVTLAAETTSHQLGTSFMTSDVTGDGIIDLVVGSPYFAASIGGDIVANAGAVYVFKGPISGSLEQAEYSSRFLSTGASSNKLGVVLQGDFTCDGTMDLLISSRYYGDDVARNRGVAWLFPGPVADGDHDPTTYPGAFPLAGQEGQKLSPLSVGDMNGDGCDDLLVLTDEARSSWAVSGFFGSPTINWTLDNPALTITNRSGRVLQRAVIGEDITGDGMRDVIVADLLSTHEGTIYGFSGPLEPGEYSTANADFTRTAAEGYSHLGIVLAAGGDVTGDDIGDLVLAGDQLMPISGLEDIGTSLPVVLPGPLLGEATISLGNRLGVPQFDQAQAAASFYPSVGGGIQVADVDGDGQTDVVFGGTGAYQWQQHVGWLWADAIGVAYGPVNGTLTLLAAEEYDGQSDFPEAFLAASDLFGAGTYAIVAAQSSAHSDENGEHDALFAWRVTPR